MISYEYPLSERVRTLLRLEDLFERVDYFLHKRTTRTSTTSRCCPSSRYSKCRDGRTSSPTCCRNWSGRDSKQQGGHLPLTFDPRGKLVTVERAGTVYLQVVFPNQ